MVLKLQTVLLGLVISLNVTSYGQIYSNGNLSTGTVSASGVNAPTGYTWSELQNNTGNTTQTNAANGFPAYYFNTGTDSYRLADDFTIPSGQVWSVSSFDFFGYDGLNTTTSSSIDRLYIQIFNVDPATSGATPIFGDMATNVYDVSNSANAFIYRIFNSSYPAPGQVINTTRKVWKFRGNLDASLPSGHYWVVFQVHGVDDGYIFFPSSTIIGSRGPVGANAKMNIIASSSPSDVLGWKSNIMDVGSPNSAPDIAQEIPFLINGSIVLGLNENEYNSFVKVAPNPVKNNFIISISNKIQVHQMELYDICGRLIKVQEVNSESVEVNIGDLKSGNYILKLKTEDSIISKIIVKE